MPDTSEYKLDEKVNFRGTALKLLEMMLIYNPAERISAKKILMHKYFDGFDSTARYPPRQLKPVCE